MSRGLVRLIEPTRSAFSPFVPCATVRAATTLYDEVSLRIHKRRDRCDTGAKKIRNKNASQIKMWGGEGESERRGEAGATGGTI